jgi:hypothetical protein
MTYFLNEEKATGGGKAYGSILLEQSVVRVPFPIPFLSAFEKSNFCFVCLQPCAEDEGKDFCFEVITKDRVYRLVAQSHVDMLEWISSLLPFTYLLQ